ncbi:MAG: GntR family transcriptional regulator [Verrucomicrobia bacterium]|nr:GntR family transcriptional regulator [Verrucomicrobiota bacterium]
MSLAPKHRDISRQLAAEIVAGKHQAAGRLPSEAKLVERFGVSRPTIGRALRDLGEQGLIVRRGGSGTFIRTAGAHAAAAHPTIPQLGLIVPNLRRATIFESVSGELASLARVNDLGLWWGGSAHPVGETDMTVEEAESLCARFIERNVAGVFFFPFEYHVQGATANRRITENLRQAGIPVLLLDRDINPFPQRCTLDLVGVDNFAGGYFLAEHLIKLGMRRLVFVKRPLTAPTVDARIAGARAAMIDHGLDVPGSFVHSGDPADAKFVRSFAWAHKIEAVLSTSDQLAAQLLQTLTRLGIKVPDDLRLVGFDNALFASLMTVPLTTIEQPCRDIAITAFNAMRDRISDPTLPPRTLLLTPRLVVRESCGAYLHPPPPAAEMST